MFKIHCGKFSIILLLIINVINSDDEITFYDQFNRTIPIDTTNIVLPYHVNNIKNTSTINNNINSSSNINNSNNVGIINSSVFQLPLKNVTPTATTTKTIINVKSFKQQKIQSKKSSSDSFKQSPSSSTITTKTKTTPESKVASIKNTLKKDTEQLQAQQQRDRPQSELFNFNLDELENDHHESFNQRMDDFNDEEIHLLQDNDDDRILSSSSSSSSSSNTTTSTTTTTITHLHSVPADLMDHVSLKNMKNSKIKIKGRELTQKDELSKGTSALSSVANLYNSVNHFYVDSGTYMAQKYVNDTQGNFFRTIINLFDHFTWEGSELRTKISAVCGVELLSYLSALNNNVEWAQEAYDSSGRYRGQLFFGNDLWLGQKLMCQEINLRNKNLERKHFEFGFFVARLQIFATMEKTNLSKILQIGECLPNSCTPQDIEAILQQDLNIKMLLHHQQQKQQQQQQNLSKSFNKFEMKILNVRHLPGSYFIWNDKIFQATCCICVSLVFIILIATIYENRLPLTKNYQQQHKPQNHNPIIIENKSSSSSSSSFALMKRTTIKNCDHKSIKPSCNDEDSSYNEKTTALELYHMNPNSDNNNIDIENNHNNNSNGNIIKSSSTIIKRNQENHHLQEPLQRKVTEECLKNGNISYQYKNNTGLLQKILLCFALGSNTETILSVDRNEEEIISCVHGIRVLSLLWTIMVHTYLQVFTIGENRFRRNITERTFWYQIIGNATFSVDSFFFISGLLVCLLFQRGYRDSKDSFTTKEFMKKGFYQTIIMIIYRYIRLTPAYLFVITINQLALKYTFNNSVFHPTIADHVTCSKYWWRNILYINNWYPFKDLCMIWSWYLANDTQFYVMAIILLIASTRYFRASIIILLTFLVTSWGTSGIFSLYFNYTHKVAEPFESFDFLYDKPWQRIGTYIIGMITGYIIHNVKIPPKIPFLWNLIMWLFSIAVLFSLIFGVWEGQLSVLSTAFYVSVGHTAWGVALIWITLSCCWGKSETINNILSYRGFLPLSRLTYCTYLIHPVCMLIISFQMEGPLHLDHPIVLTIFMGNAVLSFCIAFFISVCFEAPVIRLLKLFLHK